MTQAKKDEILQKLAEANAIAEEVAAANLKAEIDAAIETANAIPPDDDDGEDPGT
jgi:hypothetical protein